MKRNLILTSLVIILAFGLIGCSKDMHANDSSQKNIKDLKIVEWSYSNKYPDKNSASFLGDITMGSKDNMAQKAVNINLKEGQSLRIETETDYPITIMLKDNSSEEYLFNKTSVPIDNSILVDAVKKDGQYELMVDFNEIDEFTFSVYIVE